MEFAPDDANGWCSLHQMLSIDWQQLATLTHEERHELTVPLQSELSLWNIKSDSGQSAAFHLLGHKGYLCFLHFRKTFEECAAFEIKLGQLPISKYLTLKNSYVSIVELGMYHVSKKVVEALTEKGLKPFSPEWDNEWEERMHSHREALHDRCFTEIPDERYFCFYPMNKRRGETYNWYREPIAKRAEWMMEHGMTGRRFAGKVKQIITGSVGIDDWEWGVDLFTNDPTAIKRLVYEMRFDNATSMFGEFGPFYFGIRLKPENISSYFSGNLFEK